MTRFKEIQAELARLHALTDMTQFVSGWLLGSLGVDDPFYNLSLDLSLTANSPADLMQALVTAVAQPDVPPDVTEVRIMSLHKSKGLSASVVIIARCVEGLLPAAPDADLSQAENDVNLEEQRRLFFVGLTRVKADPEANRPGILVLTSSRTMSLADAMQSGIRPAKVEYGKASVHASRFLRELGPTAPAPQKG